MKNIKNSGSPFLFSLLFFKVLVLGALFTFSPNFMFEESAPRSPASGPDDCVEAVNKIIAQEPTKEVNVEKFIPRGAVKNFWAKKNGTFIGASYYKAKKGLYNKLKLAFMDINSNFRPIYYIEEDEASYAKIFKFIEAKAAKSADDNEPSGIEKEVGEWITKFKGYATDMDNLVGEYATLGAYIDKIRMMKGDPSIEFPFEIQMKLLKDGEEQILKDYIAGPEDLNNVVFKLKGKMKKLKGTSYFRFGALDTREFEQALIASRLKSLEAEIRNHLAATPKDELLFKDLLRDLIKINRDPQYLPSLKFAAQLEGKEMNAEYQDLFKNAELDLKKIDAQAKKVLENLSPRYQEKLGLNAVKNWVSLMKAGRAGVLVAGVGGLGTGVGAIALRLWTWVNYDEDSIFDIINAEDEGDFNTNLKKYLKGKFPPELIARIEKKNDNEMTLKKFNPRKKEEVEIIEVVNRIIVERKAFHKEEKLLNDLDKKLTTAIDGVKTSSQLKDEEESSDSEEVKETPKKEVKPAKPTQIKKLLPR